MDKLIEAARYYRDYLDGQKFYLRAGKKNTVIEFFIAFEAQHFYHLAGLHKLNDLAFLRRNGRIIYRQILDEKTGERDINVSKFYSSIEKRLENFSDIQSVLFSKELMIRSLHGAFNSIRADFMLTARKPYGYEHIFFKTDIDNVAQPVTYIIHPNNDYLKNNPNKWTVLSIERL